MSKSNIMPSPKATFSFFDQLRTFIRLKVQGRRDKMDYALKAILWMACCLLLCWQHFELRVRGWSE
jgi:hypothetical protein